MAWQGQSGPEDASVGGVNASFRLDTADLPADMARVNAALTSLEQKLGVAATATQRLDTATVGAANGSQAFARGVLDFSRGLEDFATGGPIGALNNIPGLFTNMAAAAGVGATAIAGLTAGVSIAATGAYVLYQNWEKLQDAMGVGIPVPALEGLEKLDARIKEVDKRIAELRAKGRLSLPESGELGKLTEEEKRLKKESAETKDLDRLLSGRPADEESRGKAFAEAVRESGGKNALDELVDALTKRVNDKGEVGVIGAEVGTPQKVAEELFRNAARGDKAARDSIRDALPGSPFASRVDELSPETKARRQAEDRFESEGVKKAQDDQKERERAAKEGEDIDQQLFDDALNERRAAIRRRDEKRKAEAKDDADLARLDERGSDLNWRLRGLMDPTREGQTLGGEAYANTFHSMTGDSPEVKRLHAIEEVLKEIRENEKARKVIAVKAR